MASYNPYSLIGKTILITGASSGIGQAAAEVCARLGASIIISGRNKERLEQTLHALDSSMGQKHGKVLADLTAENDIRQLVESLPALDGVFSNAGSASTLPVKFIKTDGLMAALKANLVSHVMLAKAIMRKKLMRDWGSYVFTTAISGNALHLPGNAQYDMGKASLTAFAKTCSVEFAPRVRFNCLCLGGIETPMTQRLNTTEEQLELDRRRYLLQRYGKPEEAAMAAAFLLSDASSFIDGTSLVVDGGRTVLH